LACFDLDRISPMPMPAKKSAIIIKLNIPPFCGGTAN
jgi:hypothetical protein